MAIKEFITHSFVQSTEGKIRLSLRDSSVPVDEALEHFTAELKHAFHRRAGREYGCFSEADSQAVLPDVLSKQQSGEINFIALSVQWMYALQAALEGLELDVQGHTVFLLEEHLGEQVFSLFVLSYKDSLSINNKLEIEQTRYIDFGTTLMAVRVEVGVWQAQASRSYCALAVPRSASLWAIHFAH